MNIDYVLYKTDSFYQKLKEYTCLTDQTNWFLKNKCLSEDGVKGVLAVDKDKDYLVGHGFVTKEGMIFNVFVSPEYRNKRIGTNVLQILVQSCGGQCLEVYRENKVALKMYQTLGFKITQELDNIYDSCYNLRQGYKMEL